MTLRQLSWSAAVAMATVPFGPRVACAQNRPPSAAAASPKQFSRPIRVCAGGDVTLGTNLDPNWSRFAADTLRTVFGLAPDPDVLVAPLRQLVSGADLVLLNVEGAIGAGPAPRKCAPKSRNCFAFRQPPSAAAALASIADSGAVVVGNVANNHSHDAGNAGRDTTIALLRSAGARVTGADTLATPVVIGLGDTIGVLGFHTDTSTPDARDLRAVRRHVGRAVARYGTVVVTMHLGAEGPPAQRTRNANERFLKENRGNPVAFADAALAAGATLVVGHGPHVLRAAEWRGNRLVLYSLGNLLTYGPFSLHEPTNRGAVLCATIDSAGSVSQATLTPTMQRYPGVLVPDSTHRAWRLVDSLSALDFPRTGVVVDSTGTLLKRAPK
ncbi:MAG TPA: CapA family protein [Gemmatimonadaceae bacterium]|nr:CapA family protein [Gemmatimonadaceae bacterium]